MEKGSFFEIDGSKDVGFYIIEETTFGGEDYLLVTDLDPGDENALAYILHKTKDDGTDMTYEEVVDEELVGILSGIFEELLGDTDLV